MMDTGPLTSNRASTPPARPPRSSPSHGNLSGAVDGEVQVRDRATAVDQRDAVGVLLVAQAAVVYLERAVGVNVAGVRTEPGDLGAVAETSLQRVGGTPVAARLEEDRATAGGHLGVGLPGGDVVERRLDLGLRHGGVVDDVRAEVGVVGVDALGRAACATPAMASVAAATVDMASERRAVGTEIERASPSS
ncbi:hypothetical protein [Isoptericola sp. BMS4]|uniref:hypothetical protein n=1 Tax=Isoptericola sp. BMS4 TaxID=2527875 RepID=UPI00142333F5|nr:hypothetical protein [Isoptericola sp. BMS4]